VLRVEGASAHRGCRELRRTLSQRPVLIAGDGHQRASPEEQIDALT
jgi:hypothetical protein